MNAETGEPPEPGADESPELFSSAWWRSRSTEELRAIMNRGIGVGAAFDGATAEAERRARDGLIAVEKAEEARMVRNTQLRRVILESLLLVCLIVLLAMILSR